MLERKLADRYGRTKTYLRVSVTDRCNFKCVYCLPEGGIQKFERADLLSFEEIEQVVRAVVPIGIAKVRLTGGEPLLRKGVPELVAALKKIDGLEQVSLTTNGALLAQFAKELKRAGLDSINISLDTLNPERFAQITQTPFYTQTKKGIEAALAERFPVKINVVPLQGMMLQEVLDLVRFAIEHDLEIRFIEFMPLCGNGWSPEKVLPIPTVRAWVEEHFDLAPLPRGREVAESYALVGTQARVGFIASLSEPFCSTCNRLRLSSNGKIRPCLFSTLEFDLLKKLREGASTEEIQNIFLWGAWNKPEGHPYRGMKIAKVRKKEETALIRNIGG